MSRFMGAVGAEERGGHIIVFVGDDVNARESPWLVSPSLPHVVLSGEASARDHFARLKVHFTMYSPLRFILVLVFTRTGPPKAISAFSKAWRASAMAL